MANRRMFSKAVTESDSFLSLSKDAQLLWFHLGMVADDDGFLNCTRMVMVLHGIEEDALNELVRTGFLLSFDSGVYLLRDWAICNQLRADRYKETVHRREKSMVGRNESNQYVWLPDGCQAVATGKDSKGESREGEVSQEKASQGESEERGAGEGGVAFAPCPECGRSCAAAKDMMGLHIWCPEHGDFIDCDGLGFVPINSTPTRR